MRRLAPFIPLIILLLICAIAGGLLWRGEARQTITTGEVGRAAPSYELDRLGGGPLLRNADLRGRAYVINMFASWCVPCRAEHPQLMALRARGVRIVGVAYKDQPGDAASFLRELGNPFEQVGLDPDGRFGLQLGITGVPETFVISADGHIRAEHRGPLTENIVAQEIEPALRAR